VAGALFIYLTGCFLMTATTEVTNHGTAVVFDHGGRMGSMALQAVCIGHAFSMGVMAFETVQKGLMLFVAEGAVFLRVGAWMGLHLTALFGMTGNAGRFCLLHC
jgi:hypothetical protein